MVLSMCGIGGFYRGSEGETPLTFINNLWCSLEDRGTHAAGVVIGWADSDKPISQKAAREASECSEMLSKAKGNHTEYVLLHTRFTTQGSTKNNAYLKKPKSWNFSYDDEKRIVTGPVMIPNKMILRRDEDGNPFYIYFTKETIRKMSEKFFAKNKHNNTDINHDENITTENTLIESWISESIQHDKSYKYGFALPQGTWYVSYKINDDETWNLIKEGELRGFSLAGGFIQKMKSIHKEKLQFFYLVITTKIVKDLVDWIFKITPPVVSYKIVNHLE